MRYRNYTKSAGVAMVAIFTSLSLCAKNAVTDWTAISSTVIVKNGGKGAGVSAIWFAYASIAAYDAVNAITGEYRGFYYQGTGPATASVDAAVIAAEHRVLVSYFPTQQAYLDAQYTSSLASINADPQSTDAGVTVGEAAAAALIAARTGDGLEANVTYTPGTGPGAWQPTPPAFLPPATPWAGQMRPFTMSTAADHLPPGPVSLSSEPWKRDYRLVWSFGGVNAGMRSNDEREIAIFWTEHTGQQYARAFANLATAQNLTVADSARLMAMAWTGMADAIIGCFNAKYKYGFWRPITAINSGGASEDLVADASWQPLAATPNHPEYPSAHGCATGAVTSILAGYFGTTSLPVTMDSLAFQDGLHTHTFSDTREWMDEVFWARMYAGFHYHRSLEDGGSLGNAVALDLLENHFVRQRPAPAFQKAR